MKLDLILENIRNKYSLGLLEESEGMTEKEVLKGKILINESTMAIRSMLVEEGTIEAVKSLLQEDWEDMLAQGKEVAGEAKDAIVGAYNNAVAPATFADQARGYADQAGEQVSDYADQASDYVDQAGEQAADYVDQAGEQAADYVDANKVGLVGAAGIGAAGIGAAAYGNRGAIAAGGRRAETAVHNMKTGYTAGTRGQKVPKNMGAAFKAGHLAANPLRRTR